MLCVNTWKLKYNLIMLALNILGCLLYTSDAADDLLCVDLGGRRIIKKKKKYIKKLKKTYSLFEARPTKRLSH